MSLETELENLHSAYVGAINAAVADGNDSVVERLAHQYEDEALELILAVASAA